MKHSTSFYIKRIISYILPIYFLVLIYSCQKIFQKEIYIKPSEIGVYYNQSLKKPMILKSGKHFISRKSVVNTYPIDYKILKRNLEILTKDKKGITCSFDYEYSLNPKEIIEFNMEKGPNYVEGYIIPNLYSTIRILFTKFNSTDKINEINKDIENELKNDSIFSKFIKTKRIILKNISVTKRQNSKK